MMNSSYTTLENSKNGILIPVKNRIYVCSKYDPVHEAEIFVSQFEKKEFYFFELKSFLQELNLRKDRRQKSSCFFVPDEENASNLCSGRQCLQQRLERFLSAKDLNMRCLSKL